MTTTNNKNHSLQGHYAGFASRFLAYIIDAIVITVGLLVFLGIFSLLRSFFNFDDIIANWFKSILENPTRGTIFRWFAAIGLITITAFLYFVIFWSITGGKSFGKALVGVRIVRLDGEPLTVMRSVRRYITFWLAAIPLFLGLLWVLGDDRRQGWHDKLSNTCVIYDWPALDNQGQIEALQTRWSYLKSTRRRAKKMAKKKVEQQAERLGVTSGKSEL